MTQNHKNTSAINKHLEHVLVVERVWLSSAQPCFSARSRRVQLGAAGTGTDGLNNGVCEINTDPAYGTRPTPPIPPSVHVHEHAHIECNRRVK